VDILFSIVRAARAIVCPMPLFGACFSTAPEPFGVEPRDDESGLSRGEAAQSVLSDADRAAR
jgi:hypothetical protein